MMNRMKLAKQTIKRRRTFTLSPASLVYLEQETRRRSGDSQSAVLDELLRENIEQQQLAALERNVTDYYDNLTDGEVEEQRAWGKLVESHLVLSDEEFSHAQSAA